MPMHLKKKKRIKKEKSKPNQIALLNRVLAKFGTFIDIYVCICIYQWLGRWCYIRGMCKIEQGRCRVTSRNKGGERENGDLNAGIWFCFVEPK